MTLSSVPDGADAATVRAMLSCGNPRWARQHPHKAMQVHLECEVGICATKTVAFLTLQQQGRIVPDSGRDR
ncbi:hypothetical protein HLB23_32440 [Nocardia uniformis]|uniref:Uncharacterized protein n=1 Tax=Nocardia uniformis TaxID=53432 RepID=A0A849C767_9NOCA|nr:hypothetical protein [Nocardia uniformis]NNH74504.1 hypothetical protein [Nocardia uniformis]